MAVLLESFDKVDRVGDNLPFWRWLEQAQNTWPIVGGSRPYSEDKENTSETRISTGHKGAAQPSPSPAASQQLQLVPLSYAGLTEAGCFVLDLPVCSTWTEKIIYRDGRSLYKWSKKVLSRIKKFHLHKQSFFSPGLGKHAKSSTKHPVPIKSIKQRVTKPYLNLEHWRWKLYHSSCPW